MDERTDDIMESSADKKGAEFKEAPSNVKIDNHVIKKVAGEAILGIDGLLGLKGGLTDLLKVDDDPTIGISVDMADDHVATISVKIIVETGKNIPNIVDAVTNAVTKALQNTTGIKVKEVCVEVVDSMTKEEYEAQSAIDIIPPATM